MYMIMKSATSPETHCYTSLWNLNI